MSSSERKARRRKTEQKARRVIVFLSLFLALAIGGSYVYAKYYAQSYQKGVAIASGIYFTANYAIEDDTEEDFFESVVSTIYQGADFSFDFEVRNYENNLLFNESTVEIPYSVSFWLEEAPTGATYTVTYGGEARTITAGKPAAPTFSMHSIAGGKAIANKYTIFVDVEEQTHTPIPVYVEVKTESGSIINSELRGRMVFSSEQRSESYIESQKFVVSDENASEEAKYAEIMKMSGFTYEIRTVGTIAAGDATEELKLSWDPAILEINMFDDAYLTWKNKTGNSAPLVDAATGWYYISIDAMPYASQAVSFFRGRSFNEENVYSMETLHSFIEAEKYQ